MEIDPDYAVLTGAVESESVLNADTEGLEAVQNGDLSYKRSSESADYQQKQQNSTIERINKIVESQFSSEVEAVERDIVEIDRRINDSRLVLDRLRASILISYYDRLKSETRDQNIKQQSGIHPAIKTEIGKSIPKNRNGFANTSVGIVATKVAYPPSQPSSHTSDSSNPTIRSHRQTTVKSEPVEPIRKTTHRIIVGNISKYLAASMRQKNDQSTHKWMVYVRGPREDPDISPFVSKVVFFLHPSYKPNDLVRVSSPPFHITRRGWGEFPIRVQLHLKDARGRKVDIIHMLKLDQTYTGLQRLGAETHVDVDIEHNSTRNIPATVTRSTASSISDQTIKHSPTKTAADNLSSTSGVINALTDSQINAVLPSRADNSMEVAKSDWLQADMATETGKNHKPPSLKMFVDVSEDIYINQSPPAKKVKVDLDKIRSSYIVGKKDSIPTRGKVMSAPTTRVVYKSLLKSNSTQQSPVGQNIPTSTQQVPAVPNRTPATPQPHAVGAQTTPMLKLSNTKQGFKLDRVKASEPVYMKYQLSNGKVMLVRKDVADRIKGNMANNLPSDVKICSPQQLISNRNQVSIKVPVTKSKTHAGNKSTSQSPAVRSKTPTTSDPCAINIKKTPQLHVVQNRTIPTPQPVMHRTLATPHPPAAESYKLPPLREFPDLETLIGYLATLHPLTSRSTEGLQKLKHSSSLLPDVHTYLSWPSGKRRALEWRRARTIRKHLVKLFKEPDFHFTGQVHWSTKNIAVWCRNNLYSPWCADNPTRVLSFLEPLNSSSVKTVVDVLAQYDSEKQGNKITQTSELIDVITVDESNSKAKKDSLKGNSATAVSQSISPTREESFMTQLVSQIGVKLLLNQVTDTLTAPVIARVMSMLYNRFMEYIIRRAHATKITRLAKSRSSEQFCEITNDDVVNAVKSNDRLLFLDNVFVEIDENQNS